MTIIKSLPLFLAVLPLTLIAAQTAIVDYTFESASVKPTTGESISSIVPIGAQIGGYNSWATGLEEESNYIYFNAASGEGRAIKITLDATGYKDLVLGDFFQMSANNALAAINWQLAYSLDGGLTFIQIGEDFPILLKGGGNSENSRITVGKGFALGAEADNNSSIVFRLSSVPGSLNFQEDLALGGQVKFDNFTVHGVAIP